MEMPGPHSTYSDSRPDAGEGNTSGIGDVDMFQVEVARRTDQFETFMRRMMVLPQVLASGVVALSNLEPVLLYYEQQVRAGAKPVAMPESIDLIKRFQVLANEEMGHGPNLYAYQSVAFMWSMYEHHVRDMLAFLVVERPDRLPRESNHELRMPLGEVLDLLSERRGDVIIDALSRSVSGRAHGAQGKFRKLYALLDLNVRTNDDGDKIVDELYAVRNLVVHNMGFVDRQFKRKCPGFTDAKLGDPLRLRFVPDLVNYTSAISVAAKALSDAVSDAG